MYASAFVLVVVIGSLVIGCTFNLINLDMNRAVSKPSRSLIERSSIEGRHGGERRQGGAANDAQRHEGVVTSQPAVAEHVTRNSGLLQAIDEDAVLNAIVSDMVANEMREVRK